MLIYLLLCGGKLWQDVCHFITMKNWKWHQIVSGRLGRLPNGAISLVMSDLHSNFPGLISRTFKKFHCRPFNLAQECMHAHPKTNACPHLDAPPARNALWAFLPRVGITVLGSSRIVKSNVCWSMEAENHWIQKGYKKPDLLWPSYRRKKLALHACSNPHTWLENSSCLEYCRLRAGDTRQRTQRTPQYLHTVAAYSH